MNPRDIQIFNLFFTGFSQPEISEQLQIQKTTVGGTLNAHGMDWIENHLATEYKTKITELSQNGHNSSEIASILGKPWNRYLVNFVARKLSTLAKVSAITHQPTEDFSKINTYRCSLCSAPFPLSNTQAQLNPDRICNNHLDRRVDERRNHNRVETTVQDGSSGATI